MGIGVTGLANALEAMGYAYGSERFLETEAQILHLIQREAYLEGTKLAQEKGSFALFDRGHFLAGEHARTLDTDVQEQIQRYGLRNSHYTSIAPTGTISQTADNVSSSVEPVYRWQQKRDVNMLSGKQTVDLYDYGFSRLGVRGNRAAFGEVTAKQHVDVLVRAQAFTDSAVSKTVNVESSMPWDDFKAIYLRAYELGAKGCTTFNADGKRAGIFHAAPEARDLPFPVVDHSFDYAYVKEENVFDGPMHISTATACFIDPVTGSKTCE
jgi:ribonucleoside-diphosphate reductase alpha chain